jgi:hypothetical protein
LLNFSDRTPKRIDRWDIELLTNTYLSEIKRHLDVIKQISLYTKQKAVVEIVQKLQTSNKLQTVPCVVRDRTIDKHLSLSSVDAVKGD